MKLLKYKTTDKSFKFEYYEGDDWYRKSIELTAFGYWIILFLGKNRKKTKETAK